MTAIKWLLSRANNFWFKPATATNLSVSRIAFFAGLLCVYNTLWLSNYAAVGSNLRRPFTVFGFISLPNLSDESALAIDWIWRLSLLLSCLGLATRLSTVTAFALGSIVMATPHSIGTTSHGDGLPLLIMLIMAFARCGDAWSLDALINRKAAHALSSEYRWPLQLARATLVLVFFASAVSKMRASRLEWIFSDNMKNILLWSHYRGWVPTKWGIAIAEHDELCMLLALIAVGVELSAPLALFSRKAAIVLIPALLFMQIGNILLLGIQFLPFYPCYMFWVPWEWLGRVLRNGVRPAASGLETMA